MLINFFTAVDYGTSPKTTFQFLLEKVDGYFYLGGRKARVISQKGNSHGIVWVNESPSILITRVKKASYFTVIIPVIMLIAKIILRSMQKFHELEIVNTSFLLENSYSVDKRLEQNSKNGAFSRPILNLDDFVSKCAPHRQAMIYGTKTCHYLEIGGWLENQQALGHFRDVFDCYLGQEECDKEEDCISLQHKTSDNRIIRKIRHGTGFLSRWECKAGLVNIVIENFKRKKDCVPIIPVVFVVEKDDSKLDINSILDRGLLFSKGFTNSEIRRAYKLCFDSSLTQEIRTIAKETFIFISLFTNEPTNAVKFNFRIRPAPWESLEWKNGMENRVKTKSIESNPKLYPWREELNKLLYAV